MLRSSAKQPFLSHFGYTQAPEDYVHSHYTKNDSNAIPDFVPPPKILKKEKKRKRNNKIKIFRGLYTLQEIAQNTFVRIRYHSALIAPDVDSGSLVVAPVVADRHLVAGDGLTVVEDSAMDGVEQGMRSATVPHKRGGPRQNVDVGQAEGDAQKFVTGTGAVQDPVAPVGQPSFQRLGFVGTNDDDWMASSFAGNVHGRNTVGGGR